MLVFIIWVIIIVIIVSKFKQKNRTQNGNKSKITYPNRPAGQNKKQPLAREQRNLQYQTSQEQRDKQYQTKKRLEKKYEKKHSANNKMVQQNIRTEDYEEKESILHKAVQNSKEVGCDDITMDEDLMKKVNDLIVMGYTGELSFERDFVAEGIDMLNRYEIQ